MSDKTKLSATDVLKFLKAKGISPEAVIRFKKHGQRLSSKQVEKALLAKRREKLKELCSRVANVGHANLYLSAAGDKVVLTGIDQLRAYQKPFNKRGFGSANHPLKPSEAAKGSAGKKEPYLRRIDSQRLREIARMGGKAAAKKRAEEAAKKKARGPHWTQKSENSARVIELTKKMSAARAAKLQPAAAS